MKNYFNIYGWINILACLTLFYFGITNPNLKPHEKFIVCLFAVVIIGIYCVVLIQLNKNNRVAKFWVIEDLYNKGYYISNYYDQNILGYTTNLDYAVTFKSKKEADKLITTKLGRKANRLIAKQVYLDL